MRSMTIPNENFIHVPATLKTGTELPITYWVKLTYAKIWLDNPPGFGMRDK